MSSSPAHPSVYPNCSSSRSHFPAYEGCQRGFFWGELGTVQGQQALVRRFNTFPADVPVPSRCAGDLDSALEGIRGLTRTQRVSDVRTPLNPPAVIVVTQQAAPDKDIPGHGKWVSILAQCGGLVVTCECWRCTCGAHPGSALYCFPKILLKILTPAKNQP